MCLGEVFRKHKKIKIKVKSNLEKKIPNKETLVEQKLVKKKRALDFIQVNLRPKHGSR
jgi:hypothetical protein